MSISLAIVFPVVLLLLLLVVQAALIWYDRQVALTAAREGVDAGQITDGQQLLLIAFGGGLSWVAGTMKWWGGAPSLKAKQPQEVSA